MITLTPFYTLKTLSILSLLPCTRILQIRSCIISLSGFFPFATKLREVYFNSIDCFFGSCKVRDVRWDLSKTFKLVGMHPMLIYKNIVICGYQLQYRQLMSAQANQTSASASVVQTPMDNILCHNCLEESGMFKNGQKRNEGGLRSSICPLVSLSVNRWRHYKSPIQASYTQNSLTPFC